MRNVEGKIEEDRRRDEDCRMNKKVRKPREKKFFYCSLKEEANSPEERKRI